MGGALGGSLGFVLEAPFFEDDGVCFEEFEGHFEVEVAHGGLVVDFAEDGLAGEEGALVDRRLVLPDFLENVDDLFLAVDHHVQGRDVEVLDDHLEEQLLALLPRDHLRDPARVPVGVVHDLGTQVQTG